MAARTRAAVSAASAASAGPGPASGRSPASPGTSGRSCRRHRRATLSVIPQNQAPNRSGERSRPRSVMAAIAASCMASRARSGEPSTRAASATAVSPCRRSSSAIGAFRPACAARTRSASEGTCGDGLRTLYSARRPPAG